MRPIIIPFSFFFIPYSLQLNFVNNDRTIRPFDKDVCLFKKYAGYVKNHDVWLTSCDGASDSNFNKAGKYQWSFDEDTGLIYSEESRLQNSGNPFCLKIASLSRVFSQRVRIDRCDSANELQKFTFLDGRIHSSSVMKLCANYDYERLEQSGGTPLTFSKCQPSFFGFFDHREETLTTGLPATTSAIAKGNWFL